MKLRIMQRLICISWILAAWLIMPPPSASSQENDFGFGNQDQLPNFGIPSTGNQEPSAEFTARFQMEKNGRVGKLHVTGMPDPLSQSHLYSQNRDLQHQLPTVFEVVKPEGVKLTGDFMPDIEPKRVEKDVAGEIWVTEEFSTTVTWTAPFEITDVEITDVADVEKLSIEVRINGQICSDITGGCLPLENVKVLADFDGYIESGPYRPKTGSNKAEWTGVAVPSVVQPGGTLTVKVRCRVDDDWNIYATTIPEDPTYYNPTLFVFSNVGKLLPGEFAATKEAESKPLGSITQLVHKGETEFVAEIEVPKDIAPGAVLISGKIAFQTCDKNASCLPPSTIDFAVTVTVADETNKAETELEFSSSQSTYDEIAKLAKERAELIAKRKSGDSKVAAKEPFHLPTFLSYCGLAFLAGLILNVMPCVLPVIGLKMMSFVEQSGEDRGRIFGLNISFAMGLISVFWLLAFLVIVLDFGWGDMLNKGLTGVIVASGIVFAFGLSLVGLWEIPIPGFASSSAANQLAEQEGIGGAFLKGVLTTILATPCVGPMLIPAMTFAMTQSSIVAFVLFTVLGLGMASPFIVAAFMPGVIKLLPKPGPWMEIFKQAMGFMLIGTVIFLMNTFSHASERAEHLMSVLTMLLSVGIGCWWIGRTRITAELKEKIRAYSEGGLVIALGTVIAFTVLAPSRHALDWKPYSDARLASLRNEGKPVFIDFTGPG